MRFATCFTVWLSVVASAALLLGWTSSYHLVVGGTTLVTLSIVILAWRLVRRTRKTHRVTRLQESPARAVLVAVLLAMVSIGAVRAALAIADGVPGLNPYFHDADRPVFVARLQTHEEAGEFAVAAEMICERMARPISPAWKATLETRLAKIYVQAGIHATDPAEQARCLELAVQATRATGQDPAAVELLLDEAEREASYVIRIASLQATESWHELIAEMDIAVKSPQPWRHPFAAWLVKACLQAGESTESIDERITLFRRAVQVAETYGSDPSYALALLANAQQQRGQRDRRAQSWKRCWYKQKMLRIS